MSPPGGPGNRGAPRQPRTTNRRRPPSGRDPRQLEAAVVTRCSGRETLVVTSRVRRLSSPSSVDQLRSYRGRPGEIDIDGQVPVSSRVAPHGDGSGSVTHGARRLQVAGTHSPCSAPLVPRSTDPAVVLLLEHDDHRARQNGDDRNPADDRGENTSGSVKPASRRTGSR